MQTERCDQPTAIAEIADTSDLDPNLDQPPSITYVSYLHYPTTGNGPRTKVLAHISGESLASIRTINPCDQGWAMAGDSGSPGYLTETNKVVMILRSIYQHCQFNSTQGLFGHKPAYFPVRDWIDQTLDSWPLPNHASCQTAGEVGGT